MKSTKKFTFGKIIFSSLLIIFLLIIVSRFSDLKKFLEILSQGTWYYILVFVFLQILYLITQTIVILNLYNIYSQKPLFKNVFNLFMATNFTNLAIPSGGFSGMATFVGYSEKIGLRKTQALIINILMYLVMFLSFSLATLFIFILPGLVVKLNPIVKNMIISFSLLMVLLNIIFFIIILKEKYIRRVVGKLSSFANFISQIFFKKIFIASEQLSYIKNEFTLLKGAIIKKTIFFEALIYAFFGHILHFLVLYFVFLAFGSNISPIIALVGYIISVVFIVASITPMGVGIVEPIMILFFTGSGISLELAALVTLIFRGIVFWMPFIWGFFSLKYINFYERKQIGQKY